MALDLSYIIPIFCRRVYHNHPDVMFKPGPFYMGNGWLGVLCNCICISWTLFTCVLFVLPTELPVTKLNMNYSSVSFCFIFLPENSLFFLQGNLRRSYCFRLVSLIEILSSTLLTTVGVVCGISRPLTSITPDPSQTSKNNNSNTPTIDE